MQMSIYMCINNKNYAVLLEKKNPKHSIRQLRSQVTSCHFLRNTKITNVDHKQNKKLGHFSLQAYSKVKLVENAQISKSSGKNLTLLE